MTIKISGKSVIKTDHNNPYDQIDVSDNGVGIPKDKLEIIFDKNQQARKSDSSKGTGIVLAICRERCQLHGGQIWAESELNQGTIIHILIPIKKFKCSESNNS